MLLVYISRNQNDLILLFTFNYNYHTVLLVLFACWMVVVCFVLCLPGWPSWPVVVGVFCLFVVF